jgi:hypothetical protein
MVISRFKRLPDLRVANQGRMNSIRIPALVALVARKFFSTDVIFIDSGLG